MDSLSHLNPAQRWAVTHRRGPLLVLAGAGTGKTRVIVHRMALLVEEGVAPENILALTFTQKAAGEMRERVGALVGTRTARRMVVGTFHAFGVRLLRADAHRIGIPNAFTILDEGDQRAQVRRLMRDAHVDEKRVPVPDLVAALSGLKNQAHTLVDPEVEAAGRVILPQYEQHLRALGAVDFDDLILLPTQLLRDVPDVAARVQSRFQHVLVDEFQDTSSAQMDFLLRVTARSRTVCAVGDDDQAIYGWRGAVVGHILDFERYFPGAEAVALEENYRSTASILAAANNVIACNQHRRAKTLRATGQVGVPVKLVLCDDGDAEVRAVVVPIAKAIQDGAAPERFAILFRAGAQARPFETELRLQGVPYVLVGGPEVTERREVKDVLAYAALLAGRDDETAFRRVVATPARGVGGTSVDRLVAYARAQGLTLLDAAAVARSIPGMGAKPSSVLCKLGAVLAEARDVQAARPVGDDPTDRLRILLDELGYLDHVAEDSDLARGARRRATVDLVLDALTRLAVRVHESRDVASEEGARVVMDEGGPLDQLLDRMALENNADDKRDDGEDNRPGVRLMTLHASKGLEFPVVFLPGWEEGIMPHRRALEDGAAAAPVEDPEDAGGKAAAAVHAAAEPAGIHGVEEERRLAYVGLTRAKEELVITRCVARRRYGQMEPRRPSRFLEEAAGAVSVEDQTSRPMTAAEQRAKAAEMFRKLREGLES